MMKILFYYANENTTSQILLWLAKTQTSTNCPLRTNQFWFPIMVHKSIDYFIKIANDALFLSFDQGIRYALILI